MRGEVWLLLVLVSALFAGCSSGPRRNAPAPVISSGSATVTPESVETAPARELPQFAPLPRVEEARPAPRTSPAVVALLAGAERKRSEGEPDAAAAALERALRIEPRNATLWYQLARIRFDQQRYRPAIELAERSRSLVSGKGRLVEANRKLIEQAKARLKQR